MTDRICVAQFGAPHGIRGEVRLRSFTQDPGAIADYGPLETEDGARRFTIEALRPAKDHFVVRLAGVDDRNAAEKLANLIADALENSKDEVALQRVARDVQAMCAKFPVYV